MTDRVKNQPGPSTIVNNPRLWPASFTKPEKQTRVCITTYIFKESTKVQKFLDFLKEKFSNRNVDVKQLDNGNISVSITASNYYTCGNGTYCARLPTKYYLNFYRTTKCFNEFKLGTGNPDCAWFRNNKYATGKQKYTQFYKGSKQNTISWYRGNKITCGNFSNFCVVPTTTLTPN